jgi:hypothetical protein
MIDLRDLNILGYKIDSNTSKKDISLVTGFNSYIQKIEHICKTQKGELPSDTSLGSNYYAFVFDPVGNKNVLELNLQAYLKSAIYDLTRVKVTVVYSDESKVLLNVKFGLRNFTESQDAQCLVEVQLQ